MALIEPNFRTDGKLPESCEYLNSGQCGSVRIFIFLNKNHIEYHQNLIT